MHLNPSLEEITVVDLDGDVVNACKAHLQQTIFDHASVTLVVQDALQLMEQNEKGSYDGIICDLTTFPVGYRRSGELRGFYQRVFDLSAVVLKDNGWFSMYAGSVGACLSGAEPAVDMLTSLLQVNFQGVDCRKEYIPCLSESSNFLYCSR